jgi:hypothetical protein
VKEGIHWINGREHVVVPSEAAVLKLKHLGNRQRLKLRAKCNCTAYLYLEQYKYK